MAKICVDDKNIKLPHFIEVVPTVYLTEEKKFEHDYTIIIISSVMKYRLFYHIYLTAYWEVKI